MNPVNEDHFFDLAMKSIAGQATDSEIKELESLISANQNLKAELDRLRGDVKLAKEAMPLVDAMQAKGAQLPGYARQRLQSKVKRTLAARNEDKSADCRRRGRADNRPLTFNTSYPNSGRFFGSRRPYPWCGYQQFGTLGREMERSHCDQHIEPQRPQVLGVGLASKCTGIRGKGRL